MSTSESQMRFLCSCDAEMISDYERINLFVRVGMDLVNEIESLKRQLGIERRATELAAMSHYYAKHPVMISDPTTDVLPPCDVEVAENHHGC